MLSPESAAPENQRCVNCGATLKPTYHFCGECGHPVESGSPTSQPVAQTRPPEPEAPRRTSPPPPPLMPAQAPPTSDSATVMAQPPPLQQPPAAPPKRRRSGCRIVLLLFAVLTICCLVIAVAAWYLLPSDLVDFANYRDDLSRIDQLLWGDSGETFLGDIFFPKTYVSFENATDFEICALLLFPTANPETAENLLNVNEFMSPGDVLTIEADRNTVMDYVAFDCFDNELDWGSGISIETEDLYIRLRYLP